MEDYFLKLWYTVMQVLFCITPLIYLALSSELFKTVPVRGYQIILPLLTSFTTLCLVTEAYNLARPVYVCFYPIRRETIHHPEQTRLNIQWILNSLASVLAAAAAVCHMIDKVVGNESRESQAVFTNRGTGNQCYDHEIKVEEERRQKETDIGRLGNYWRSGLVAQSLMMIAWAVGMCGYWIMSRRSKEGTFSF
jgi:hypothetical protein